MDNRDRDSDVATYVAEENLDTNTPATLEHVQHSDLGCYFSGVNENGYVPNEHLKQFYPDS